MEIAQYPAADAKAGGAKEGHGGGGAGTQGEEAAAPAEQDVAV